MSSASFVVVSGDGSPDLPCEFRAVSKQWEWHQQGQHEKEQQQSQEQQEQQQGFQRRETEAFDIGSTDGSEVPIAIAGTMKANRSSWSAAAQVTRQMEQMRNLPLLVANPELQGTLFTAMYNNQSSVLQVLPQRLDMLAGQVQQLKDVLGARFAELMKDGEPDAREAEKIIACIRDQLFKASSDAGTSVLDSLSEEVERLKQDFKANHGGLKSSVEGKQRQIGRKVLIAKGFDLIYKPSSFLFNKDTVDYILLGSLIAATSFMLRAKGVHGFGGIVLGVTFSGLAALSKVQIFGATVDFEQVQVQLRDQWHSANKVLLFCNYMECLLAEVENDIKTVELHRANFTNQADQVHLLLQNRLDVRRWNASRLHKFLKEQDLDEFAETCLEHGISGKAFLDVLDQDFISERIGAQNRMTCSRVLKLKRDIAEGRFLEPSPQTAGLVMALLQSMEQFDADVQNIKQKLLRVFPW